MSAETDETYFRKYLNDVSPVQQDYVQEPETVPNTETNLTTYFRKYLNDVLNP